MFYYFVKRGLKEWFSYRTALLLGFLNQIVQVTWGYYLSKVVHLPTSTPYVDYFSYLLLGIVFQRFLHVSIYNYVQTIRNEQVSGTLETALLGTDKPWNFIILQGSVGYIKTLLLAITAVLWGFLLGGRFVLTAQTIVSGSIVVLLGAAAMMGFGLMAAGFVMVTKQGDPVTFVIETLNYLLTGLYYPIEVLPKWLQYIGKAFPLTYALDASREVFIRGKGLASLEVYRSALVMLGFAIIFIPVGAHFFSVGYQRARKAGTLSFF